MNDFGGLETTVLTMEFIKRLGVNEMMQNIGKQGGRVREEKLNNDIVKEICCMSTRWITTSTNMVYDN